MVLVAPQTPRLKELTGTLLKEPCTQESVQSFFPS